MADTDGKPLDEHGSPGAVGMLAFMAVALSVGIYEMRGSWPAEYGGWAVVFLTCLGVVLVGLGWKSEQ